MKPGFLWCPLTHGTEHPYHATAQQVQVELSQNMSDGNYLTQHIQANLFSAGWEGVARTITRRSISFPTSKQSSSSSQPMLEQPHFVTGAASPSTIARPSLHRINHGNISWRWHLVALSFFVLMARAGFFFLCTPTIYQLVSQDSRTQKCRASPWLSSPLPVVTVTLNTCIDATHTEAADFLDSTCLEAFAFIRKQLWIKSQSPMTVLHPGLFRFTCDVPGAASPKPRANLQLQKSSSGDDFCWYNINGRKGVKVRHRRAPTESSPALSRFGFKKTTQLAMQQPQLPRWAELQRAQHECFLVGDKII